MALIQAQLSALDRYHATRRRRHDLWRQVLDVKQMPPETRLDIDRQREVDAREHAALVRAADRRLAATGTPLDDRVATRAVLAHHDERFTAELSSSLDQQGLQVVAEVTDAADACGVALAEQPDLLFVEDRLPGLHGLEVVRRALDYTPEALVAVQLEDDHLADSFLSAGAGAVFSRRVPPAEIAALLVSLLNSPGEPIVVRL